MNSRNRNAGTWLLIIGAPLIAARTARAQPRAAASFNSGQVFIWTTGAIDATRAWEFTVNQDLRVTAIGVYDRGSPSPEPGLGAPHDVIIWDISGAVAIPMATVPAGTTGTLIDRFRYVDVPTTTLLAGRTYVVAAFWPQSPFDHYPDVNSSGTPITYDPSITFVRSRTALFQPGLSFPTILSENNFAVGVVNFLLEPAGCDPCDANCDGTVDAADLGPFVALLLDPGSTPCSTCAGDANGDGAVDARDIARFVDCMIGP